MSTTISHCNEKLKPQVKPDHYYKITYDTKERFCSYWHQIHEVWYYVKKKYKLK